MSRSVPMLTIGWTVAHGRKVYATRRSAYYAIAKDLVVAKYPAALGDVKPHLRLNPSDWPDELIAKRADKAVALFNHPDAPCFDERRWRKFVTRVARFLMFVDSRRELAEQMAHFDAEAIESEYQRCESSAITLATRAAEMRTLAAHARDGGEG